MNRRAFLVCGPESSGNRLMTRLLVAAGCYGDGAHFQRLDRAIPVHEHQIVWMRSVPHAHEWPDLSGMVHQLRGLNYTVQVVVMSRDWTAVARSQVAAGHAPDEATALSNIREAWRHIFTHLNLVDVPYVVVNYESLVQRPSAALAGVMALFGLPLPEHEYIYDGNVKWFQGEGDGSQEKQDARSYV